MIDTISAGTSSAVGKQIRAEVRRQDAAVLDPEIFGQRVADRLRDAAFDLRFDLLAVDRAADVVDADHVEHRHFARRHVDLDLNRLRDVAVAVVRRAAAVLVERRRRGGPELHGRRRPGTGREVAKREFGRRLSPRGRPSASCATRRPSRRSAPGRIVGDDRDRVERERERLGGDLAQDQVRALTDIGGADAHPRRAHAVEHDEFDRRGGLFGKTERVTDVLDPAGDSRRRAACASADRARRARTGGPLLRCSGRAPARRSRPRGITVPDELRLPSR